MHVSPGWLFTANELKSMLAHVVMSCNVKLEDNKTQRDCALTFIYLPTSQAMTKFMLKSRAD
ncbi:hypothetical protein HD554DRAFT_2023272 [Boletus coccyginus]|nr:hypothetical protein HD554DRAFT_2023272 [Boletus coccyginus]